MSTLLEVRPGLATDGMGCSFSALIMTGEWVQPSCVHSRVTTWVKRLEDCQRSMPIRHISNAFFSLSDLMPVSLLNMHLKLSHAVLLVKIYMAFVIVILKKSL